jgi:hypothetical protein
MSIFTSSGKYIGFTNNEKFYSVAGDFLGWIDDNHVWDKLGNYRGKITEISGAHYILKDISFIDPAPRPAREESPTQQEQPSKDIASINLPFNLKDAFQV